MGRWGALEPEDADSPEQGDAQPLSDAKQGTWGVLGSPEAEAVATTGWGALDGPAADASGDVDDGRSPAGEHTRQTAGNHAGTCPGPGAPGLPPPEATASLLQEGEILWARVDRSGVRLGSGQQLFVSEGILEQQEGWRRVQVVDPATLAVRVLSVSWSGLRSCVGDDPALLYRPAPPGKAHEVDRVPSFPIGQGPDLRAVLDARIIAAESAAEKRGRAAERRADESVVQAEREADERITESERQAEQRVADAERSAVARVQAAESRASARVAQVEHKADKQITGLQAKVVRTLKAMENVRMQRLLLAVLACIGWVLVLLLWGFL